MTPWLDTLARMAVTIGCSLTPGQRLVVTAPLDAAPLVRAIAQAAWAAGAADVTAYFDDPELLRLKLQTPDGPDVAPDAQSLQAMARDMAAGAARIQVLAPRPDLVTGVSAETLLRAHKAFGKASEEATAALCGAAPVDTAIPMVTEAWARLVFADLEPAAAVGRLQEALATILRQDAEDPAAFWRTHLDRLEDQSGHLQALNLEAMHLRGAGTDLTIALSPGRAWTGGWMQTKSGRRFAPRLPAEGLSVPVAPTGTQGRLRILRPIALAGDILRGADMVIENGAITELSVATGEGQLERLLNLDAGARSIRGLVLVDQTGPAARHGLNFYNPMLDACCACHIVLGGNPRQVSETSDLRLDAFFGDETLDVDGIDRNGKRHAVIRAGAFQF